jgi:hypothetical protein
MQSGKPRQPKPSAPQQPMGEFRIRAPQALIDFFWREAVLQHRSANAQIVSTLVEARAMMIKAKREARTTRKSPAQSS